MFEPVFAFTGTPGSPVLDVTMFGTPYRLSPTVSTYRNNGVVAVSLVDAETGEPFGDVTVNLEGARPSPGCLFVKNYTENEGLDAVLVAAGWVEPTGRTFRTGYVVIPEMRPVGPLAKAIQDALGARV